MSTAEESVHAYEEPASMMAACGDLLLSRLALHQHLIANILATSLTAATRVMLSVHDSDGQPIAVVVIAQGTELVSATVGGELTAAAADAVIKVARDQNAALIEGIQSCRGRLASLQVFVDAFLRAFPGFTFVPGLRLAAMELRGACSEARQEADGGEGNALRQVVSEGTSAAVASALIGALSPATLECTAAVLDTLAAWNGGFFRDALGGAEEPPSMDTCRQSVLSLVGKGDLYVWEAAGKGIVAMAAVTRRLLDVGCSVSLVYTPPEHRENGFAAKLMIAMCTEIAKQGKRVFLFVDLESKFSTLRLYEKIGFCNDGQYGEFRLWRDGDEGSHRQS